MKFERIKREEIKEENKLNEIKNYIFPFMYPAKFGLYNLIF